jgi:hypothetical protein
LQIGADWFPDTRAMLILDRPARTGVPPWMEWSLSLGQVAITILVLIVMLAGFPVLRLLNIPTILKQVAIEFGMAPVGSWRHGSTCTSLKRRFSGKTDWIPRCMRGGRAAKRSAIGLRQQPTEAGLGPTVAAKPGR